MFTGIIDHCGTLIAIQPIAQGLRFAIRHQFDSLERGESIAVNGICLTVTAIEKDLFYCDLSPETLNTTTAHTYQIHQPVNLERALLPTSRMGGHIVSGHVDSIYCVTDKRHHAEFVEMVFAPHLSPAASSGSFLNCFTRMFWHFFSCSKKKLNYLVQKGSIAIDGVSLTVNTLTQSEFSVMLVPHTLQRTTLSFLEKGHLVNIEFDMILKWAAANR